MAEEKREFVIDLFTEETGNGVIVKPHSLNQELKCKKCKRQFFVTKEWLGPKGYKLYKIRGKIHGAIPDVNSSFRSFVKDPIFDRNVTDIISDFGANYYVFTMKNGDDNVRYKFSLTDDEIEYLFITSIKGINGEKLYQQIYGVGKRYVYVLGRDLYKFPIDLKIHRKFDTIARTILDAWYSRIKSANYVKVEYLILDGVPFSQQKRK